VSSLEARVRPANNIERQESENLADYRKRVWVSRARGFISIGWGAHGSSSALSIPTRNSSSFRRAAIALKRARSDSTCSTPSPRTKAIGAPPRFLLLAWCPTSDGLRVIAEIIHDIDLKDSKFGRTEAAGIDALISGICTRCKDDDERLQRGSAIFDDLFESFSRRRR
jgi:hypothetical protein